MPSPGARGDIAAVPLPPLRVEEGSLHPPSTSSASSGRSTCSERLHPATSGRDALDAIAAAYRELIESDRTMLQGSSRRTPASVVDDEVRESTARGYGGSSTTSRRSSGRGQAHDLELLRQGMLMNVLAAMDYSIADGTGLVGGPPGRRLQGGRRMKALLFFLRTAE
jgi:hypothetical protein